MTTICAGIARSLGLSLGPVMAAVLVYVDFHIGELQVDKNSNPGWVIAIACLIQTSLLSFCFPRHGSTLLRRKAEGTLQEPVMPDAPARPFKELLIHRAMLAFVLLGYLFAPLFTTAWEVSLRTRTRTRIRHTNPY